MKQNGKNFVKLVGIILGMLFLFCLWLYQQETVKEVPEGEKISIEDVHILLEALEMAAVEEALTESYPVLEEKKEEPFTYAQYRLVYEAVGGADKGIPDFADKYEDSYAMLKEDWYEAFHLMLAYLDTDSSIWKTTIFILKTDAEQKKVFTENNVYDYRSSSFDTAAFCKEEVYVKGGQLLTCIKQLDEKTILENVWVMETTNQKMDCFYHQVSFTVTAANPAERESVADLTFADGRLVKVQGKRDKIHGKLLRVSDTEIEIEGYGVYPLAEQMETYKLYGTLESLQKSDLLIGYENTDFVVWNHKICAALVSRKGDVDKIRVLLTNSANGSYFYEEAVVVADGEETLVQAKELKEGERVSFQAKALTDKVVLKAEGVEKADNAFRGALEFCKTKQGMILVNELPLEEYLYAVVPSEMPASYPAEALKAQAVCARTYAYRYILHAGLAQYGAHLDDTTAYQVYHNIGENAASTMAVRETEGVMLYYQNALAQNYYYSTSCGYGTDTQIWKSESAEDTSYLRAGKYAKEAENKASAEEMAEEERFAAFIRSVEEDDFEKEEIWYRWRYEVEEVNEEALFARIEKRYQVNPALIQKQMTDGEAIYYVEEPIDELGSIKEIRITKRGSGGVADEMLIEGSKAVVKVIGEYNIRSILCDGETEVYRQDESSVVPQMLLPSGFFIMETGKKDGDVIGYTLIGGGYGHGVGMSQNGAKVMGSLGYQYKEILHAFFADCEVRK